MALAFQMDNMEGVGEEIAALYTEKEGKFMLTGIEGISPKSKVDEFRNSNIELTNQLKGFEGIDPAKYATMTTEIDELKIRLDKTDLDEEQIEKIVAGRVKKMSDDFVESETGYKTTISTQSERINTLVLDGTAREAAVANGIAETAVDDVIGRVRQTYTVGENGSPIGTDGEGKTLYDSTGQEILSINDYVKGLTKTAPHLFQESVRSNIPNRLNFKGDPSKMTAMQKISGGLSS